MSLRLHDTATRSVRDFVPLRAGEVSMYQCGPTVQSSPHIGHVRSGLVFDVLHRWLLRSGYKVTLVRNVTDIDDKILRRAEADGRPWWALAAQCEREFQQAYRDLGCVAPTIEPRATGHMTQIVGLIDKLIAAGSAYAVGADVYFSVASFADYGRLSGQRLDELQPGDADEASDKRDPRDFALWKGAKAGEPSWPTPWGPGRPGWHIECSAMASVYLGSEFDIHGGGIDLVFPHHENEIAQARAAGEPFARMWVHNAWVTAAGEKMGKSLGNALSVANILGRVRPIDLRWYLISAHYRSNLEFSDAALDESAASLRRIEGFLARVPGEGERGASEALPAAFANAMDDDLAVPAALAVIHETVTAGNRGLAAGNRAAAADAAADTRSMLAALGCDPLAPAWAAADGDRSRALEALDSLVAAELEARDGARAERDFATADAIRRRLADSGIRVEDRAGGSTWSLVSD